MALFLRDASATQTKIVTPKGFYFYHPSSIDCHLAKAMLPYRALAGKKVSFIKVSRTSFMLACSFSEEQVNSKVVDR